MRGSHSLAAYPRSYFPPERRSALRRLLPGRCTFLLKDEIRRLLPGTFLLKDDPYFADCYNFAFRGGAFDIVCPSGAGPCLITCFIIWFLNGITDFFVTAALVDQLNGLVPCTFSLSCFEPVLALISGIIQLFGSYLLAVVIKKTASAARDPNAGLPVGGGYGAGPAGGPGGYGYQPFGAGGNAAYVQDGVLVPPGQQRPVQPAAPADAMAGGGYRLGGGEPVAPAGAPPAPVLGTAGVGGGAPVPGSGGVSGGALRPTYRPGPAGSRPAAQPMLGGSPQRGGVPPPGARGSPGAPPASAPPQFQPFAGQGQTLGGPPLRPVGPPRPGGGPPAVSGGAGARPGGAGGARPGAT